MAKRNSIEPRPGQHLTTYLWDDYLGFRDVFVVTVGRKWISLFYPYMLHSYRVAVEDWPKTHAVELGATVARLRGILGIVADKAAAWDRHAIDYNRGKVAQGVAVIQGRIREIENAAHAAIGHSGAGDMVGASEAPKRKRCDRAGIGVVGMVGSQAPSLC